ncbi:helix-turn-helix transcriptional regulator [Streptomyces sp. NBC_01283]|uniref:winged helix-turn-helix transcriptional regulator n=1 Tax=Streptomyces sp. NBC_01283 TaxID=2903812 RepID=UPI00352D5D48|nr:helix-turn-helix transcriptional regulator [Streptomyces sp. NBC_01283]
MTRSYDQSCPAARALDVVGGRWSLLIVRELLLGPRRYTDLVTGLPGIGPNVLAERLRALRKAGILSQVKLPPPASSAVYELTELGTAMRPVLDELTRWGMRLPTSPRPGDTFRLSWVLGCLRASFRPEEASGVRETYEFRVDGDTFHLRVDDGVLDIQNGSATDPVCAITTDLGSFLAIGARLVDIEDAVARGLARLEGELPAAARVVAILGAHPEATGGRHGIVGAVGATFRPDHALGVRETYEFVVGDLVFHARVDDGTVKMDLGPAPDAVATIVTDLGTFLQLGVGSLPLEDALSAQVIEVSGDPEAGLRMADAFGVVRADRTAAAS